MAIGGYLYGKLCEKAFQPDDRAPPTVRINDGEDYVPMKKWKNSLIQLLNIEGTGSLLEEEYVFPKFDGLPENAPMGKLKKDEVWFPVLEHLFGFGNLVFRDSVHYEFQIPKKDLVKFDFDR